MIERGRSRAAAGASNRDRWLPPEKPPAPEGFTPEAEATRMKWRGRRAVVIAVVLLASLVTGIVSAVAVGAKEDGLLHNGVWVTGFVVGVATPTRGAWTIAVEYPVKDHQQRAVITLDSKTEYVPGDDVVVIYDGNDPTRVRTVDDSNTAGWADFLIVAAVLLGLATVFPVLTAFGWFRRARAVRRTGWYPVAVSLMPFRATFQRGDELLLGGRFYWGGEPKRAVERPRQPAWLAGERSAMVLLFPQDNGERPYLLPAHAKSRLLMPASGEARRHRRKATA